MRLEQGDGGADLARWPGSNWHAHELTIGGVIDDRTTPPEASTVFRVLAFVKKPSVRLSGDQNGNAAPSVPASGRASSASKARTHNTVAVPCRAPNARRATSRDI